MEKILTPEAQKARDAWNEAYDGGNCSCHISAPCGSCEHEGNPRNQKEDETCWENPSPQSVNDWDDEVLNVVFAIEGGTSRSTKIALITGLLHTQINQARATALHDAMEVVKPYLEYIASRNELHNAVCIPKAKEALSALTSLTKD